jgi:hypothetical protein
MSQTTPPRRQRHLLDLDAPRPAPSRQRHMSLTQVQRWVLSILAVTTILHLSVGIVLAAIFLDDGRLDAQIGLNVIAAAFGVIAIACGLAIHRRPILSPWLLLGLLPGIVGLFLTLR